MQLLASYHDGRATWRGSALSNTRRAWRKDSIVRLPAEAKDHRRSKQMATVQAQFPLQPGYSTTGFELLTRSNDTIPLYYQEEL